MSVSTAPVGPSTLSHPYDQTNVAKPLLITRLTEITMQGMNEWFHLGLKLDIPMHELQNLDSNRGGNQKKFTNMLEKMIENNCESYDDQQSDTFYLKMCIKLSNAFKSPIVGRNDIAGVLDRKIEVLQARTGASGSNSSITGFSAQVAADDPIDQVERLSEALSKSNQELESSQRNYKTLKSNNNLKFEVLENQIQAQQTENKRLMAENTKLRRTLAEISSRDKSSSLQSASEQPKTTSSPTEESIILSNIYQCNVKRARQVKLRIDKLSSFYTSFNQESSNWYGMGLALGLSPNDLDSIKSCDDKNSARLREMFSEVARRSSPSLHEILTHMAKTYSELDGDPETRRMESYNRYFSDHYHRIINP